MQDRFTILVQQHKLQRVFNLEFSLEIRIEKKEEFKHYVDWSLKTLRALGRIYNTNMSEITVRKVSFKNQPIVFTWSNDSLPTNYCPKTEIEKLFKVKLYHSLYYANINFEFFFRFLLRMIEEILLET